MLVKAIKNRIDIVTLAEKSGLELKRQGKRFIAFCPFHKDTNTPNLTIYPGTKTFKCYTCNKHGDVINFYTELKKLEGITIDNNQAIKELVREYDIKAIDVKYKSREVEQEARETNPGANTGDFTPIYEALQGLCGDLSAESLAYLTGSKRGLTPETIKQFKIFDIQEYKKAREILLIYGKDKLKQAGLLLSNNRFAFTKNKIVIPLIENEKIVSLRARFFDKGQDNPKLLKTITYTYPKIWSLPGISGKFFNVDILKTLKPGESVYLCEGEFDTMIAVQSGVKAIGLLGVSNYNPGMLTRLKDFDLIILLDTDEPGRKQSLIIAEDFYKLTGKPARVPKLPEGFKDLTEFKIKHPGPIKINWKPRTAPAR